MSGYLRTVPGITVPGVAVPGIAVAVLLALLLLIATATRGTLLMRPGSSNFRGA